MPNAMAGVQRAIAQLRSTDRNRPLTVRRLHRRAVGVTRRIVDLLVPVPTRRSRTAIGGAPRHLASHRDLAPTGHPRSALAILHAALGLHPGFSGVSRLRLQRRLIRVRLGGERALPMGIALAVIVAGAVSLGPGIASPVGAAQGDSQEVRLAIGGMGSSRLMDGADDGSEYDISAAQELGAYIDDGTFYKPVAVDTVVESGSSLLRHYTVKSGDTLTGIASKFGVSMMTLWWANKLDSKDSLHQGQSLVIPPVNGLVITVKVGDTLDAISTKYKVDPQEVLDLNNLSDPLLVVGQVLILPGAKGAPIPTAKPTPRTYSSSSSGSFVYTGGSWAWPVVGGGNYISQYFHSYHPGIDIAAKYGTPIVAPRAGQVVFAGWKDGGGAYQVWIYHGNNLYTAYLHMSAVLVSAGQVVSRGQMIGRIGMSGNATGPHVHFAVSVGRPWQPGSYFLNPLRYY